MLMLLFRHLLWLNLVWRWGAARLEVTEGSSHCHVDANGCVTDGPGDHGHDERCTVLVHASGTVTAIDFDVEDRSPDNSGSVRCWDYVQIGSASYCGTAGPSNVAVAAGSTFTWTSDDTVAESGWTICLMPGTIDMLVIRLFVYLYLLGLRQDQVILDRWL